MNVCSDGTAHTKYEQPDYGFPAGSEKSRSENIWPVDPRIEILGQTFDHTIVDIENSERDYRVGDLIAFEVDYTGLLAACTSESVNTVFVTD